MVVFEGQSGSIGGHQGRCEWANDSGAAFRFNEYGDVTFGSNGYGENSKVTVQLNREYKWYFCSTSVCGGFKNWVSSLGTVTERVVAGRVSVILFDCITKLPMPNVKVCLGLMCQVTPANGEVYLGQFAFGTYSLVIAKTGYENLVEPFVVNSAEHRTSRCLTPTGAIPPTGLCEDFPVFLQPVCKFFRGLLVDIETKLTALLTAAITKTELAIADVRIEVLGIWVKLDAWLTERIVGILIRALDNEMYGGKKI